MALANITRLHSDTPILCGLACVIPTLAALAPLQISSAAVIAAFFVCLRRIQNGGPWFFRQATYIILILSLIIWSGLSSIWSIDGLHSLSAAFRLLLAATTLIILVDAALRLGFSDKDVFLKWMAYGAIIGVAVTLIYIATIYFHTIWIQKTKMEDYELNALNRSASVIAIFLWPWTFAILKTLGRYSATLFVAASSVTVGRMLPSALSSSVLLLLPNPWILVGGTVESAFDANAGVVGSIPNLLLASPGLLPLIRPASSTRNSSISNSNFSS